MKYKYYNDVNVINKVSYPSPGNHTSIDIPPIINFIDRCGTVLTKPVITKQMRETHASQPFMTFDDDVEALYQAQIRRGEFAVNDLDLVVDMIFDAMAELPELAKALGGGISGILTLPNEEKAKGLTQIVEYLSEPQVPAKFCESYFARYSDKYFGDFIKNFNDPAPRGRKRVLFLAISPYFQILREAMFLRRLGYSPCLIYLRPIPEDLRTLMENTFDLTLKIPAHMGFLGAILDRLNVDLLHIQTWMVNAGLPLPRFAIERKPEAATVCEFYDIISVYAEKDIFFNVWSSDPITVELDFGIEEFVCNHADAVSMRCNPDVVATDMKNRWGAMPPTLQMWPYPVWEYTTFSEKKYSQDDGIIRFVYAGSLRVGAPEISVTVYFLPAVKKLLEQGFAVDIMHEPQTPVSTDIPHLRPYIELMEENPKFRILDGVPPHLLGKAISRYDFAFSFFDADFDTLKIKDIQRQTAIGTKSLSYVEAGLPMVVNSEFSDTAKFVNENGLGFSIRSNEIGNIKNIVENFDYAASVANIKNYVLNHSMEKEIWRLGDLYHTALTAKGHMPALAPNRPGVG